MKTAFALTLLVLAGAAGTSFAQSPGDQAWTVTLSGAGVLTQAEEGDDPTGYAGAVSLERRVGDVGFGLSVGAAGGDDALPEALALEDTTALDVGAWFAFATGLADVEVGAVYGRQSLDGTGQAFTAASGRAPRLPALLQGRTLIVEGERDTAGVSITLSRTFGDEVLVTPALVVSFARTETEGDARTQNAADPIAELDDSQEGATVSLGVSFSRPLSASVRGSLGVAALYSENAAAETLINGRASDALIRRAQSAPGSAEWAELNTGLSFDLGADTALALSAGGTLGREQEDLFAAVSVSRNF